MISASLVVKYSPADGKDQLVNLKLSRDRCVCNTWTSLKTENGRLNKYVLDRETVYDSYVLWARSHVTSPLSACRSRVAWKDKDKDNKSVCESMYRIV